MEALQYSVKDTTTLFHSTVTSDLPLWKEVTC